MASLILAEEAPKPIVGLARINGAVTLHPEKP
jgi:hypothetical protein